MSTLLTLIIGIFIGWNLPQPTWARNMQDRLVELMRGMMSR